MPYDTFVIYFLFFPTLALVLGILVSHPPKVIGNFLLSSCSASLFLMPYFFFLETLLFQSHVKVPNLYFNYQLKIGTISALQLGYYFLIPWFIGSVALLVNRLPKSSKKRVRRSLQHRNLTPFFMAVNILLLLDITLLYLSFEDPIWYKFRLFSLNMLWILPILNGFLYFRSKKKFYLMGDLNWAGILAGIYTMVGLLFVNEKLSLHNWYTFSEVAEDLIFTGILFLVASDLLILFSYLWYVRESLKKESPTPKEEWLTPFLALAPAEEGEFNSHEEEN